MFKHLTKLIWNRKRENALIIIELIAAFLVIFYIAAVASHTWQLYRKPLGFEWQGSYAILVSPPGSWSEEDRETLRQVLPALRQEAQVEYAHAMQVPLFRNWRWTTTYGHDGVEANSMINQITPGGHQDIGVSLLEGRWFEPADRAMDGNAVLINRRLRDRLFPDGDSLGTDITNYSPDRDDQKPTVVIGVFEDFRQWGELSELEYYILGEMDLSSETHRAGAIIVRPTRGTPVAYEERLQSLMESLAPTWRVSIAPLEKMRDDQIQRVIMPIIVSALLGGFLLLMVAFGLFGVLWQNVTRRTDELGLRRALGATRKSIYRQIVYEIVLVAGLAVAAGSLLAVQLPMLGTFRTIDWPATWSGIAVSMTALAILCTLCALYPAWLASRRSPAEALHYE